MKLYADYHTHTVYSHGTGSIEDNVLEAIKKGLTEIAIADHGPGSVLYGIDRNKLPQMRDEIDALNQKYGDKIKVYLSVEANILSLDGRIDVTDADRKYYDLVLMGYHRFVRYEMSAFWHFFLNALRNKKKQELIEKSTDAFIRAVTKNEINYITHPSDPLPLDLDRFAPACIETETHWEINCKHQNLSPEQVKKYSEQGVKFLVGSDAHKPEDVGGFTYGYDMIEKAGVGPETVLNLQE